MTSSCPDCGAEVEFTEQPVRLRTGTCSSCGHELALFDGTSVAIPPAGGAESADEESSEATPPSGLECEECGSPLSLRARPDGSIEARCDECESTAIYVPQAAAEERAAEDRRGRRPERGDIGPPSARPCRKCGGPLRFSTNEEGEVVGECSNCGNRFTLPPRRDGAPRGRGYGARGRYGDRPFAGGDRRSTWGGSSARRGPRDRRYGRDRDDEGSDDRRRRRRKSFDR